MKHDYKQALEDMQDDTGWCVVHQKAIRSALELAIALQPKPISEAPIGTVFDISDRRYFGFFDQGEEPTHYYDLSALPKVEEVND